MELLVVIYILAFLIFGLVLYSVMQLKLLGIKRILECDNIRELYLANKSVIDSEIEQIDYREVSNLEIDCINMYSDMYDEILYKTKEEEKIGQEEYKGTKIDIYEIDSDFNMFVKVLGACNGYKEP